MKYKQPLHSESWFGFCSHCPSWI